MDDLSSYSNVALYTVLAVLTGGTGVGMIIWQTGATQQALITRRGVLAGGVLMILFAGLVLVTQVLAFLGRSYG